MKSISHRSLFVPVVASLIVLAWTILWTWERSPYGHAAHVGLVGVEQLGDRCVGVRRLALRGDLTAVVGQTRHGLLLCGARPHVRCGGPRPGSGARAGERTAAGAAGGVPDSGLVERMDQNGVVLLGNDDTGCFIQRVVAGR